ncbi:MAG: undecaprenyl-phosphate glucose phosphotransferase [Chloroflexi bacterium]|nr:undecaprenyl-phosphate glucose phosphotransferase [Chloroflexota bacterium]
MSTPVAIGDPPAGSGTARVEVRWPQPGRVAGVRSRAEQIFLALLAASDVVAVNAAVLLAYVLRFETDAVFPTPLKVHPFSDYYGLAVLQSAVVALTFFFHGMYRPRRGFSRIDELYRVFTGVSIATVVTMAVTTFVAGEFAYSRALLTTAWALSVVIVWVARVGQFWLHSQLRRLGVGRLRVVVVGTGEQARIIRDKMRGAPNLGYDLLGFVRVDGSPDGVAGPVIGELEAIDYIVAKFGVGEVILADSTLSHRRILDVVGQCDRHHTNVKIYPDVFQIIASEVTINDLNGLPMLAIRDVALRGWKLSLKRAMDICLSALVLVVVSPMLLLIALLIKLTSPRGPVFYVQERVGLDGRPFPMIKFRSMRVDAEGQTGPVWAQRGDPRTTRLGAFLRRFSLDELPQLVNVLMGDMSIVGPRPERPYFVEQFSQRVPRYLDRHREKAGLTGWAQVNGLRGNTSVEERTAYDLWYVENWNLLLDLKIILRTILTVFRDKNAY